MPRAARGSRAERTEPRGRAGSHGSPGSGARRARSHPELPTGTGEPRGRSAALLRLIKYCGDFVSFLNFIYFFFVSKLSMTFKQNLCFLNITSSKTLIKCPRVSHRARTALPGLRGSARLPCRTARGPRCPAEHRPRSPALPTGARGGEPGTATSLPLPPHSI